MIFKKISIILLQIPMYENIPDNHEAREGLSNFGDKTLIEDFCRAFRSTNWVLSMGTFYFDCRSIDVLDALHYVEATQLAIR